MLIAEGSLQTCTIANQLSNVTQCLSHLLITVQYWLNIFYCWGLILCNQFRRFLFLWIQFHFTSDYVRRIQWHCWEWQWRITSTWVWINADHNDEHCSHLNYHHISWALTQRLPTSRLLQQNYKLMYSLILFTHEKVL